MVFPLLFALLLIPTFIVYKLVCLLRNIRLAKATGLPYTFSPILEFEVYGYITTPFIRFFSTNRLKDGQGWPRWARFMVKDWPWEDKRRAHEEFGDVFLVVAPGGLICYSSDAYMAIDVMVRKNDFTKPPDKYSMTLTDDKRLKLQNLIFSQRYWSLMAPMLPPPKESYIAFMSVLLRLRSVMPVASTN